VPEEGPSRKDQIVRAAIELLESEGPDGVSMRAIADRVGIRAPSLYKHFADKAAVETAMIAAAFREQAEAFVRALADATDPLDALARAYRGWASAHPHLYRLMTHRPLPRERLPEGVEDAAALPVLQVVGGDPDRARALWAFAHGMTSLELADRFPESADLDAAWRTGIQAFRAWLPTSGTS
jgi:AcrR family transcriptional regulator